MSFVPGAIAVFDKSGRPLGAIRGFSVSGPRTYRINELEDFAFTLPRNSGPEAIIGRSAAATLVGARSADGTGAIALANPTGTTTGDVLVAGITYRRTAGLSAPSGWTLLVEAITGTTDPFATAVFWRTHAASDPTIRSWSVAGGAISGVLLAYRGMFRPRVARASASSGDSLVTSRAAPTMAAGIPNSTRLDFVGVSVDRTASSSGATVVGTAGTTYGTRALARTVVTPAVSASPIVTLSGTSKVAIASVVMDPVYGLEQLLMRDNLVYLAGNGDGIARGWGGYIDTVNWSGGEATVTCQGMLGLLAKLSTATIEQDGGEAFDVAKRLVAAANAKKAAHDDLQVEIVRDGSRPIYGKWTYDGDILKGISSLLDSTTSEAYMETWIDATTGRLRTRLRWGSQYDVDMTAATGLSGDPIVIRDGTGGNLTPGTEIDFSGAERANFARLVGARTNLSEHLDYPSVQNVLTDYVPEATVSIPEDNMPGARRREILDLSVDWGFSTAQQKAMALEVQDRYLTYYKTFLYAYHDRFGAPFLEGFDWSGPKPEEARKLSMRHYRTFPQLARIGSREIVLQWDPDSDADVTLEGWHLYNRFSTGDISGMAFDYSDPRYRWQAIHEYRGILECVISVNASPPYNANQDSTFVVAKPGETVEGITTDPTEPGTMWVLTRSAGLGRSYVRAWDIATRTPVSEWSVSGVALNDIAVDAAAGFLWSVNTGSTALHKRDINSGAILETFTTGITTPVGISVTGGVAYVAGQGGRVEMRFLDDGGYAGAKTDIGYPVTGIFVDGLNSQVWVMYAAGVNGTQPSVYVYSAAIAIAVTGGSQPVDGAPGFPQLAKGAYVRIVMADDRIIGDSPDDAPKPNQIKDVLHRNQHGHYVNGKWTKWPPTDWPTGTDQRYTGNCVPTSASMLLDRHTYGKERPQPHVMRRWTGDRSGEVTMSGAAKAWKHYGYTLNYVYNGKWSDLIAKLKEGRGIMVFGLMKAMPRSYRCQSNYTGKHAMYLHKLNSSGTIRVHDPLCRKFKNIPSDVMRKVAGLYAGTVGKATFAWSRDTTSGKKVVTGKTQTVYAVWSEGRWKDQFEPNQPGDPVGVTKVWDPGEQKSGFRKRTGIQIATPNQVIYGEEGRVGDWDPVSMGYGRAQESLTSTKSGKPTAFYRASDGTVAYDQGRRLDADHLNVGYHLVPWDVPLTEFRLAQPAWPEGEEYLRVRLEKFNREQGQQALTVINRDGLWSKVVLGGRYALVKSLDGPYPDGIVGQVRVREFAPDEATGTLALMTEWVG